MKFEKVNKKTENKVRVLVLNPPSPDESYINRDQMGGMGQRIKFGKDIKAKLLSKFKSKFIHLPVVQLVYIATILEKKYPTMVIDALNDEINLKQVLLNVKKFEPSHVFMATSSSTLLFEKNIVAKKIKEIVPMVKIISIGDTIPNLIDIMSEPIDIAIIGEVEKIASKICDGVALEKIKGIIYMKNGKRKINKKEKLLERKELNNLPFPNWSLFNYKNFTYYPMLSIEPVATILSSRGCPYACKYCSYSKNMGTKWRARIAKNVVDEIENDVKKYGFKGIVFRDPLFSLDKKRVEEICGLIIERKLKIQFVFETRPELLTKKMINNLYKAGCRGINLGIEDIHPETLKNVGRQAVNIDTIKEIVNYAEKRGIRTTCFFILGLPETTRKLLDETIKFSLDLNPSHAEYKILTPYPGTDIYEIAKKNGMIKKEEYEKLGGYSSVIKINKELSPEYLDKLSSQAFKNFYFRAGYIFREFLRGAVFSKANIIFKNLFKLWFGNKKMRMITYNISLNGNKIILKNKNNNHN